MPGAYDAIEMAYQNISFNGVPTRLNCTTYIPSYYNVFTAGMFSAVTPNLTLHRMC